MEEEKIKNELIEEKEEEKIENEKNENEKKNKIDKILEENLSQNFIKMIKTNPKMSLAVIGISVLTECIKNSTATTMMELHKEIKKAVDILKDTAQNNKKLFFKGSLLPLASGCELFTHFITKQFLEMEFDACKEKLIERGKKIRKLSFSSKRKIAKFFKPFIRDNMVILAIGHSQLVINTLKYVKKKTKKRFKVLIPEMRPDCEGFLTAKELLDLDIPCKMIVDSAVSYNMGKIDFVVAGAEGVVESGGIVNKIGTYQIALTAKVHNKPFYVVSESFKFVRNYPLKQEDISIFKYCNPPKFEPIQEIKEMDKKKGGFLNNSDLELSNPASDYTPPSYITLLFTDIGILTPSGISDELIQLYS